MEVLVVVDMQNDFIDGSLGTKEAVSIVPKVADKIKNFKGMVLATQGMSMTTRVIEALKAQGFKGVYIDRKSTEARDTVHIQEPIIDD